MKSTKRYRIYFAIIISLINIMLITGCSQIDDLMPGHKLHVQQGNVISKDMVKQIKIGMSKQQAKYILGSPVLENVLESNEYTYVYTEQNAVKNFEEKKLILTFKDDKLVAIKGSGIKKDNIGQYDFANNNDSNGVNDTSIS